MKSDIIRQRFDQLEAFLKSLDDTFQRIETYVVPYRGEFFKPLDSEQEVDWRRRELYDSTAPIAADLLASSIHSNLTSPMIPWFKLRFRQDQLNETVEASEWLEIVQGQIWQSLQESDFDMEMAEIYLDLVSFGTAILFQEEITDGTWEGITFTAIPVRDGYFEYGADDKVLRMYRRLQYTKMQLEDKFPDYDFDFLTNTNDEDKGPVDEKHTVVFCVYKRDEVKEVTTRMKPEARPWGYQYVLHRNSEKLDEGGYYQMPAHVPRWKKVSGSRWGHSPAFIALSDIIQINQTVADVSESRAKKIDPPMMTTERGLLSDLDLLPGGLTVVMAMDDLAPLLPPTSEEPAELEINRLQESIRSTFYVDKLELKESPAMTATEVLARLDKQQRQFAPTLGRLKADLLDPVIEWTFDALTRNGLLPEMPQVVLDSAISLDIEYTGPIPRSMNNEEAHGVSLWLGELAGLGEAFPDIKDVADTDEAARGLGLSRGVPAAYMRSNDDIKTIREDRRQAMEEARQMEQLQQAAKAAKDLGATGEQPALEAVQ